MITFNRLIYIFYNVNNYSKIIIIQIVIIGPVDCRRGVFHLWKNNIRLVGGEVEDLVQSNTMENLLSEAL